MALVSDVMDKVARGCRVTPPSNWISSTTTTSMELKDLLDEVVDELLDRVDWPNPITLDTTIAGDGTGDYDLPADFKRLTRDPYTIYETTHTRRAGIPVASNGDWTTLVDLGSASGDRFYRLSGNEEDGFSIEFFRVPAVGDSITVSYVTRNWLSVVGTPLNVWTDGRAVLLLPRRLIELGIVWRFRRAKGLSYSDRAAEYEIAISRLANDYRGIRKINFGGPNRRNPFDIPVPDYIPPA